MAVIAKQRYKLDIAPKGGWVIVYASQHDDGAREIEFEITNQGNAFSIPASINVSVQGIKANKSYFSHSCSYSGNIVTMALADDMTDVIGKAICVLKFINSSQQKLATAKFILNVDSDSSSEGIIIDTEAEEIFNQMLNDIRAQAASISADIAELQSMVGSPLVASTVSAMTDHNKIYVYTGSESGYTNGNWYYWNGSAWTSGGVYNSNAFETDKTLSVENMPADAFETGKIKNKVENLTAIEYTETGGYYDASGVLHNPTSNNEVYTQYISVASGQSINVDYSLESNKSMWVGVVAYNSNKIFISRTLLCDNVMGKSFSGSYTVPDGVAFVRIMWRYGNTALMLISYGNIPFDFIFSTQADLEDAENTLKQITSKNLLHISTSGRVHNGITFSVDKDAGTITANGTSTNTSFVDAGVFIPEKSGQYKIIGTPPDGGTSKWYTSLVGQARQDVGGGAAYELTGGTAYTVRIIIAKNQTIENLIFQPQIYDINLSVMEKQAILGAFPLRREFYYDHLFIDTINTVNAAIPSESLFNINTSKRLGFSVIEANVQKTSDNAYVVMHGVADGQGHQTFGSGFYALNGDDISNVSVSSVTLEYIKTNVRYNSIYAKYRVAPLTLAEFLTACKKEKLIPLVQCVDEDMCKICDEIMGASNWIAYNAERSWTNAIIMTYKSVANYEQALNFVGLIGHPCMLCISNVAQITDENMLLIIHKLHHYGYFVGNVCAYDRDEKTQKLLDMGIDFSASGWNVPLFEDGNICNLIGNVDFTDFTTTGNAENGTITLDLGETITMAQELSSFFLSKGYLCVRFEGTITITLGTKINNTFTSDGTKFLSLSTYFLNAVPTFLITATSATIVYDIVYKASKC